MKQSCDYHPTMTAHWFCPKCSANLCPECVIKRDKGGYLQGESLYFCPKCNIQVQWCGVANIIDPFWKRLSKIFAYPFSSFHPIVLIISLSLLSSFFSGPGLLSLLVRGALFLVVLKYSYEALKATASGDLRPPKISSNTISDDFNQVLKQYVLYFLIFLAFGLISAALGLLMGVFFILFAAFFIPAMIILLVTTSSLLHALNPNIFVRLTYRIGWGYLLMYLFLFLLAGAPAFAEQYIDKLLPTGLHFLLVTIAQSYYTIISYHLMGYVILQYHDEVGYEIEHDAFKDQSLDKTEPVQIDPGAHILKEINPLIQDGKYDDAIEVIEDMTHGAEITSLELSNRYYSLLKMTNKTNHMLEYGINHLELIIKAKQKNKALEIYSECIKTDPEFVPSAVSLFKIAEWLNETGKFQEAVKTFNRLIKEYPENPLVPKAYFRAAQLFNDRMMNPEKAKKILNGLIKKYPEHEIVPQIENYITSIM
ncbi:MAG: tetratricopeptide repeat protein [Pseudomonadota bacterium]